jgi:hypothetical protein
MSPTFGSTNGGQVVEIDGNAFVPGAEQVFFGATPGTILADGPTIIFVSAPAEPAGVVSVSVQTPAGSAAAGNFTYVTTGIRGGAPTLPYTVPFRSPGGSAPTLAPHRFAPISARTVWSGIEQMATAMVARLAAALDRS